MSGEAGNEPAPDVAADEAAAGIATQDDPIAAALAAAEVPEEEAVAAGGATAPAEDEDDETMDSLIPSQPLSPEEEKAWIMNLKAEEPELAEGQTWYLLDATWWKRWKDFVSYDYSSEGEKPDPIDNKTLLEDADAEVHLVRRSLMERFDYIIITKKEWRTWMKWYGGGPTISRKVIKYGWYNHLSVEVRPLNLQIVRSSDLETIHHVSYSKTTKVGALQKEICKMLGIKDSDVRLWDYHADRKIKLLTDPVTRLDEAQIIDGQKVLFEEKGEDGKFPKLTTQRSGSSYHTEPTDPGKCGLMNLGNTCFMNSSLQCLSQTTPLTKYFLKDTFKTDLNTDNPLGCNGELAEEYSDLLKLMWGGTCRAVAPRDFKWKMERFAPQFSGYQQHDSQELLSFLLDGLHEDLNRIKKKPYVLKKDSAGRPDAVVAKEHWIGYRKRNDSPIVDHFQGQLKSRLQCPECGKISITFDPFMYLSLPMPIKKTREMVFTLFFQDSSKLPRRYKISVPKMASIAEFKKLIGEAAGVDGEGLLVCDTYNHKFFKIFNPKEGVGAITDRDMIHVYQVPVLAEDSENVHVAVYHEGVERTQYYGSSATFTRRVVFGIPFFVTVPASVTASEFIEAATAYLKPRQLHSDEDLSKAAEEEEDDSEEGSDAEGEDSEDGEKKPVAKDASGRLFDIKHFDLSSAEADALADGEPLDLKEKTKMVLMWRNQRKYNIRAAKTYEKDKSMEASEEESPDGITLDKCLELFTIPEKLAPEDAWYCNVCKKHQQASKKFDIWSAPPILVIHLKRFSYRSQYMRDKLDTFVDFPLEGFNLKPHILAKTEDDLLYDCYAVSNHFGSLGGGHYTAFGKNAVDGNWYNFDDSSVSPADVSKVKSSAAYVLFYKLRSMKKESWDLTGVVSKPEAETDSKAEEGGDDEEEKKADVDEEEEGSGKEEEAKDAEDA